MLATLAALLCLPSLPAADPQDSTTLQSRVPSIPTLIADLKSSVPDPRPRDALNTLLSFGEPAIAPLTAALDSPRACPMSSVTDGRVTSTRRSKRSSSGPDSRRW